MSRGRLLLFVVAAVMILVGGLTVITDQRNSAIEPVPNVVNSGVKYAREVWLKDFSKVRVEDALSRNRSTVRNWLSGGDRDWVVCFQDPAAGRQVPRNSEITLSAVPNGEKCPRANSNEEAKQIAGERYPMPDFYGKTLPAVRQSFGPNASLTFFNRRGREVDEDQNNYRVCQQQLTPGHDFYGQPIAFIVIDVDPSWFQAAGDLETDCPRGDLWMGVPGREAGEFPLL